MPSKELSRTKSEEIFKKNGTSGIRAPTIDADAGFYFYSGTCKGDFPKLMKFFPQEFCPGL